jgi:hypothetical protein
MLKMFVTPDEKGLAFAKGIFQNGVASQSKGFRLIRGRMTGACHEDGYSGDG